MKKYFSLIKNQFKWCHIRSGSNRSGCQLVGTQIYFWSFNVTFLQINCKKSAVGTSYIGTRHVLFEISMRKKFQHVELIEYALDQIKITKKKKLIKSIH